MIDELKRIANNDSARKRAIVLVGKIAAFGLLVFPLVAAAVSLLLITLGSLVKPVIQDGAEMSIVEGIKAGGFMLLFAVGPAIITSYIVASIPGLIASLLFMTFSYIGFNKEIHPLYAKTAISALGAIIGGVFIFGILSLELSNNVGHLLWIASGITSGAIGAYIIASISRSEFGAIRRMLESSNSGD